MFAFEARVVVVVMCQGSKKIEGLFRRNPLTKVLVLVYITSVMDTIFPPLAWMYFIWLDMSLPETR